MAQLLLAFSIDYLASIFAWNTAFHGARSHALSVIVSLTGTGLYLCFTIKTLVCIDAYVALANAMRIITVLSYSKWYEIWLNMERNWHIEHLLLQLKRQRWKTHVTFYLIATSRIFCWKYRPTTYAWVSRVIRGCMDVHLDAWFSSVIFYLRHIDDTSSEITATRWHCCQL